MPVNVMMVARDRSSSESGRERTSALDRAGEPAMTTEGLPDQETDAVEWHREKVMNGEFDEIPEQSVPVEVQVSDEVEEYVRRRYQDILARGETQNFTDLLLDHITLDPQFALSDEPPVSEPRLREVEDTILVKCRHCEYEWEYSGDLPSATCPSCTRKTEVPDEDQ